MCVCVNAYLCTRGMLYMRLYLFYITDKRYINHIYIINKQITSSLIAVEITRIHRCAIVISVIEHAHSKHPNGNLVCAFVWTFKVICRTQQQKVFCFTKCSKHNPLKKLKVQKQTLF